MSQTLSTNPIPGTRDFFPEEMSVRRQVFDVLYRVVESFGYVRYDGPMLEPFELYAAKSSDELVNQQIYRLTDRGGRELVIRPEMTPTVARMIAARAGSLSLPARWYSHPNLYRYERKQRGRYREHWQVNVDVFGTDSWEAEAEVFRLCGEMMFALGAKTEDFVIRVSDRQLMEAVLKEWAGVRTEQIPSVFSVLDRAGKVPEEETASALSALGVDELKVLGIFNAADVSFIEERVPREILERSNIYRVLREWRDHGLQTSRPLALRFDPRIVRGFLYYTSTVFEVFDVSPQNPRSIAGGGRYDNLVALFGKQRIPGIGFGMGDVTLIDFLETHGIAPRPRVAPDVHVMGPAPEDAAERRRVNEIAQELRRAGLRVVVPLEPRRLGKTLERAARDGVRFAVIAGAEEAARGAVKLRDLARSAEQEVARADLARVIRDGLAATGGGGGGGGSGAS